MLAMKIINEPRWLVRALDGKREILNGMKNMFNKTGNPMHRLYEVDWATQFRPARPDLTSFTRIIVLLDYKLVYIIPHKLF